MNKKTWWLSLLSSIFLSSMANGSIAPQMVNLNLQFKVNNTIVKSDLSMPMYQTAEIEKQIGKKNYLISLSPKQGQLPGEVSIEVKFLRHSNSTPFYKTQVIAKLNQKSTFTAKGVTMDLTPVI